MIVTPLEIGDCLTTGEKIYFVVKLKTVSTIVDFTINVLSTGGWSKDVNITTEPQHRIEN